MSVNESTAAQHPPSGATAPVRVAVLGLGAMGTALARTLLIAGHPVAGWNRTPKDLVALGLGGARSAPDPAGAVHDAAVVLVCVRNHETSRPVIHALAAALPAGVPVVNLSSGTPDQAVESARAASALGIDYVTGAIMVPTPLVGTDDNLILYAGSAGALDAAMPVLRSLGGTADVLGADHAVPPVLDMAMLGSYFAGMYAFLHSAAMVRAHGIEPGAYLPYARAITSNLATELDGLANAYQRRRYDRGQASLEMCLSALDHVVATSEDAGVDAGLPRLIRDVTRAQLERAPREADWESVVERFTADAVS